MKILILLWRRGAGTYSDGKLYTRSKKRRCNPNSGIISGLWCYSDILVETSTLEPINYSNYSGYSKIIECGQVLFETVTDILKIMSSES
jgi:hypothetical protein